MDAHVISLQDGNLIMRNDLVTLEIVFVNFLVFKSNNVYYGTSLLFPLQWTREETRPQIHTANTTREHNIDSNIL